MSTSPDHSAEREERGEGGRRLGDKSGKDEGVAKRERAGRESSESPDNAKDRTASSQDAKQSGDDEGSGSGGETVEGKDDKRIRPWDPPDYNRQRQLADRLSKSHSQGSRPRSTQSSATTTSHNSNFDPASSPYPSIQRSPYAPRRPRTVGSRMSNGSASPRKEGWSEGGKGEGGGYPNSPRRQTTSACYPSSAESPRQRSRQPPLFPNPSNERRVTDDELDVIITRVTRPTVASRGGVDLQDKEFVYIPPRRLKTLPVVPGLERRYLGLQPVGADKMEEIVYRLTRLTSAYQAKFAPNRNVWVDTEPGAHLVSQRRSAQSAR